MKKYREIGQFMVVDPEVCFGKLTFKGTRLMVERVIAQIAFGASIDDILRSWPYLSKEAVQEALEFASAALNEVTGAASAYSPRLKSPQPWRKQAKGTPRRRSNVNGRRTLAKAAS